MNERGHTLARAVQPGQNGPWGHAICAHTLSYALINTPTIALQSLEGIAILSHLRPYNTQGLSNPLAVSLCGPYSVCSELTGLELFAHTDTASLLR